jgi:hypothetical protein
MTTLPPPLRPYILGVDPGLTGAIALYDRRSQKLIDVIDMPVTPYKNSKGQKRTRIEPYSVATFVDAYCDQIVGAVIEEVGAAPNQGVVTTFKFGFVTGVIHGIIAANMIQIHTVKPAVWKTILNLSQDKNLSRIKAQELFPDFKKRFDLKKHDGRAEAALLAKFGERLWQVERFKN